MTARARHDRGDRRIDPDADACGIGTSIHAVQPRPPHRPAARARPPPGCPGMCGQPGNRPQPASLRGGQGAPSAAPPRRRRRTTARIGSKRPRPQCSHAPHRMTRYGRPRRQGAEAPEPPRSATCANARRLRLLSVTGFPSASVLGWQSLRMQTDHMAWPSPAAVSALLDPVRGMRGSFYRRDVILDLGDSIRSSL